MKTVDLANIVAWFVGSKGDDVVFRVQCDVWCPRAVLNRRQDFGDGFCQRPGFDRVHGSLGIARGACGNFSRHHRADAQQSLRQHLVQWIVGAGRQQHGGPFVG